MLPCLLDLIAPDQEIGRVTADGACDTRRCHEAIAGATHMLSFHHARTPNYGSQALLEHRPETKRCDPQRIFGRALWRNLTGCHRRSRVETNPLGILLAIP
jgi:hypothetical protein